MCIRDRLDRGSEAHEGLSVDQYPASLDKKLSPSPGSIATGRDVFMEAHDDGLYRIIPLSSRLLSWEAKKYVYGRRCPHTDALEALRRPGAGV